MVICHTDPQQFHTTTVDLHIASGRNALIRFQDLEPSAFQAPEGLDRLGFVTISIADVDLIDLSILKNLLRFLDRPSSGARPALLMGLFATLHDLHHNGFQWPALFHQLLNHPQVWLMECRPGYKADAKLLEFTTSADLQSH